MLQTTGRATKTGVTGFFNILPVILAGFFGGAIEFERILTNMRGRVFGVITAGAWVAMPLGMLLGGILTDRLGTFIMMVGLAATFFITTMSMAFIPP